PRRGAARRRAQGVLVRRDGATHMRAEEADWRAGGRRPGGWIRARRARRFGVRDDGGTRRRSAGGFRGAGLPHLPSRVLHWPSLEVMSDGDPAVGPRRDPARRVNAAVASARAGGSRGHQGLLRRALARECASTASGARTRRRATTRRPAASTAWP